MYFQKFNLYACVLIISETDLNFSGLLQLLKFVLLLFKFIKHVLYNFTAVDKAVFSSVVM